MYAWASSMLLGSPFVPAYTELGTVLAERPSNDLLAISAPCEPS
jgi:hypothetical protein